MEIDKKEKKLPDNPSWDKMISLCATLMFENEQYKKGWPMELVKQAKRNAIFWFAAWVITMGALIGTNAAWLYVFQSYEYVSQDGNGINNINTGEQGDLANGPEGQN